jgi:hypothetical protein
LVRVAGFEPTTFGSASQRSIQLSYTRITGVILSFLQIKIQGLEAEAASEAIYGVKRVFFVRQVVANNIHDFLFVLRFKISGNRRHQTFNR